MVKAFIKDACSFMNINYEDIHFRLVASLPTAYGIIPQYASIDPKSDTIIISNVLIENCRRNNGFTLLRTEVYAKVRMLYLFHHPEQIKGDDIVMSALAYSCGLMLLKGLRLPMVPPCTQEILKEEFGIDAIVSKLPFSPPAFQAQLTAAAKKQYTDQYHPSTSVSTVTALLAGDKGTKENPFENVYEAVEYINVMESEAHAKDSLLQDIEHQQFFYDPNFDFFRIPWASSYVSQYQNDFPPRTFMVNQMSTLPGGNLNEIWYSLKPNLYQHKFLYRGQSDSYEGIPCVPNLFRDKTKNTTRDYIEFIIFSQELELLIKTHPLVQLFENGFELLHDVFHFRVNYPGLAQHYYNKSRMLDLSSDLEVMKFFATTEYDWKTDKYTPCTDTLKLGVIYCYELQYPGAFQQHEGYALKCIGKQPFMRPGSQCGFLLDMDKDIDLKNLPEVTALYFKHDPVISHEIFAQSNEGKEYFAEDLLQLAWKDRMRERREKKLISIKTVEYNANINGKSIEETKAKLASIGVTVDDFVPSFTDDEIDMYYQAIETGWWEDFCDDIHFYGAEDSLYRQALKELPQRPEYACYFKKS